MYTHTKRIQEVYAMGKGSWRKAGENATGEGYLNGKRETWQWRRKRVNGRGNDS